MKSKLKHLSLLAFSIVAVPVMLSGPASAVRGNDDSMPGVNSTPKPSVTATPRVSIEDKYQENELGETEVKTRIENFNTKAEDAIKKLEAKKEATKKRTEQERKTSCETRSVELTNKLNKKVADAEKHKAVFDKIFTRVKNFHDTKKLTTANYDSLVAKVDVAQQTASDSITTLKAFDTKVNCSDVNAVATKVAAFKEAMGQTRDSLKAYRTAIKDLIVSIKASIPEASTTPTPTPINTTEGN